MICDNMASTVIKNGWTQGWYMDGADHIAANGEFSDKIGSSSDAVLVTYCGNTCVFFHNRPAFLRWGCHPRLNSEIRKEFVTGITKNRWCGHFNLAFDVTDRLLVTGSLQEKASAILRSK